MSGGEFPELFLLGILLLIGWTAHAVGTHVHVPRVTLLLLFGLFLGPSFLDVVPDEIADWFPHLAHLALAMVGFLLGESFVGRELKESGRVVMYASIGETIGAAVLVFLVCILAGLSVPVSLLLAGIAPASAPAATLDVIRESHAKGPLSRAVIGVVAINDAWSVILFSVLMVIALGMSGAMDSNGVLLAGLWDVGGAVILGILVGIPMSWVTGRVKEGEPTLVEAAGFVFLCGGLALYLGVSYLIACMVLGAVVANLARHHTRPFREIEGASDPFLVIFFVLAGYECDLEALASFGLLLFLYVVARTAGMVIGGGLGARLAHAPSMVQKRIGWCLLPKAGVSLGLALLVAERMPEVGELVLPLVIGTTMVFEVIGPLVTRWHLQKAGEL